MKEIRIYIHTDAQIRAWTRCIMAYSIQYIKDGQMAAERTDRAAVEGHQKAATLEALISTLTRIADGNALPVTVICHCPGVIAAINQKQYSAWSRNGWKNSQGNEVECAALWERVVELIGKKAPELTARPPEDSETEIMHKLGAETFDPKTPLR